MRVRDDFPAIATLVQGDMLSVLDRITDLSIDMIFADPPYNLSNDGFTCKGGRMVSVNKGDWDVNSGIACAKRTQLGRQMASSGVSSQILQKAKYEKSSL